MRIVLAGGGTGGHFYPIIAVAEAINDIGEERKLVDLELIYLADKPYDARLLFENHITYKKVQAGKRRTYRSILNTIDLFKTAFGLLKATWLLYRLYPDVVFCKGGYPAFPVVFAAKLLRIPVVLHETDSAPGRVNQYAGKFARYIAISWEEAAQYFDPSRTALTGNPVRKALLRPLTEGAYEFLDLEQSIPTILITGGSQGAQALNDAVLDALPRLLEKYQIIHQTGPNNIKDAQERAAYLLKDHPHAARYKLFAHLDETAQRMAAGVAKLIISRSGGAIFEFAAWGVPSILVPITDSNGDHQRRNAYEYARADAAVVIEEGNATATILEAEIERILQNETLHAKMSAAAKAFAKPLAARQVAEAVISIGLEHE